MKKLMTMIATVAMAFGLYADGAALNSSFVANDETVGPFPAAAPGWSYSGAADTLNITDTNPKVLDIATGTAVLSRNVAANGGEAAVWTVNAEKGLFADMIIDLKSQALEDVPTVEDGKIAIFALDSSEIEGAPGTTNLWVMAGYGADGSAIYNIGALDDMLLAQTKRIVIKAYNNVIKTGDARGGFLVFVGSSDTTGTLTPATIYTGYAINNGVVDWTTNIVGDGTDYLGLSGTSIVVNPTLTKWLDKNAPKLFLSIDVEPTTTAKFNAIDFKGNAQIASIALSETNPGFPDDAQVMSIATGEGFVAITNVTGTGALAWYATSITGIDGEKISIYPAFTKDIVKVSVGSTTISEAKAVSYEITFSDGNEIKAEEWDTGATVKIGDGAEILCKDIGEAIKAANEAASAAEGAAAAKITLNAPVTDQTAALTFTGTGETITLDLNGYAITGSVNLNGVIENSGRLVIKDSAGGGYIENTKNGGSAVGNTGTLTIEDSAWFKSELKNKSSATLMTIAGGKFDKTISNAAADNKLITTGGAFKNDSFAQVTIPGVDYTTYEVILGTEALAGYWVVRVKPVPTTYVVEVEAAVANSTLESVKFDEENVGTTNGFYTAEIGNAVTATYTANNGYQFANGETTSNITVNAATIIEAPTVEAINYAITVDGGVGTATPSTYTVAGETVTLEYTGTPAVGKKFSSWTVSPETGCSINDNTLTIAMGTTGPITVTPQFADLTFTVTFTTNNLPMADKTLPEVVYNHALTADQIPEVENGTWDINPIGAVITCTTNFNATVVAPTPDPVIDPTKPDEPVKVKAADEEAAKKAVKISVPADVADDVTEEAYQAYFTKTAEETSEGSGEWNVTAKLSDAVVKAADETTEVAAKLSDIAAAATATSITIENAKPGLYYSLVEGSTLEGRTEGTRAKARTVGVTLQATHYEGSGFYQIKVSTTAE